MLLPISKDPLTLTCNFITVFSCCLGSFNKSYVDWKKKGAVHILGENLPKIRSRYCLHVILPGPSKVEMLNLHRQLCKYGPHLGEFWSCRLDQTFTNRLLLSMATLRSSFYTCPTLYNEEILHLLFASIVFISGVFVWWMGWKTAFYGWPIFRELTPEGCLLYSGPSVSTHMGN